MSTLCARSVQSVLIVLAAGLVAGCAGSAWAQADATEPTPPAGQEYIGTKKCAACHFDQFGKWKKTKHSTTFKLLPEKYQADAKCLKCHTTGFGTPTGFKTAADEDLKNTSCEACHGPGSKHAEMAKPFTGKKPTPEEDKMLRASIWKILPGNACISCHMQQGHHDSMTPPELRTKK